MSILDWIRDKERREIITFVGGGATLLGGALWSAFIYFDVKNWIHPKTERDLSLRDIRPLSAFRRGPDAKYKVRYIVFGVELVASNKGNTDVSGCRGEVITPKSVNVPIFNARIYRQDGNVFSVNSGTVGQKIELHFEALTVQYTSTATFRVACQDEIITPLVPVQLLEPIGSFDDSNAFSR